MGWSESYYEDMKAEAGSELLGHFHALHDALADYRTAVVHYREFVERADEMEELLRRLEELLPGTGKA